MTYKQHANKITNIEWYMKHKQGFYKITTANEIFSIIGNNRTPLLTNNQASKEWVGKNYKMYFVETPIE